MELAFQILVFTSIIGTIASSLRSTNWWIKVCDVSRVHMFFLLTFLLSYGLFFLPIDQPWVTFTLFTLICCFFYHLKVILPFVPLYPTELSSTTNKEHCLKILSINVRLKNKKYQNLIQLVEEIQPDLFLLTEVDQKWIDAVSFLQNAYPFSVLKPLENTYGIALYSKYELVDAEIKFLVQDDVPSIHTNVKFKDHFIQILGLHPKPPAPWTSPEKKDLELIKVAGMTNINSLPTIVTGDLNDVGWSKITQNFKQISGLLDPRIGRGFFNTYNALIPIFQFPVDHFFVSKHFKLLNIKRLPAIGSDHFPVFLEVNLENKEIKK